MVSRGANKLIKLGWIGAGGINFGSLEGPWNHAVRMQKQNEVQFTAVVDPNVSAAQVYANGCLYVMPSLTSAACRCCETPLIVGLLACRNESNNTSKDRLPRNGRDARHSKITNLCCSRLQSQTALSLVCLRLYMVRLCNCSVADTIHHRQSFAQLFLL